MRLLALLVLATGGARVAAAQDPAAANPPAQAALSVEAVLARSVVERVPQDTGTAFPADVGEVVLWTKVSGGEADDRIHHVWFHGDTQVGDVELRVGGSPWRTWSRKTIPADATGAWRVEVRTPAGDVLGRVDFTIG